MANLILRIVLVTLVAIVMLYLSRFWPFQLWGRQSLLAEWGLRPGGGLFQFWLRGTPLATFELVLWACAGFLALSAVEKICASIAPREQGDG